MVERGPTVTSPVHDDRRDPVLVGRERSTSSAPTEHRPPLRVTHLQCNQALVLVVAGYVDLVTAPDLRRALDLALATSPRLMVVDLSEVRLLACAGLTVLVAAHQLADGRTCLRVAAERREARRPLELTGVDRILSVHRTCEEALTVPHRRCGSALR